MPTTVTTLNLLTRPLYMLPLLVASAPAFQSWVGASSVTEAQEHVHWPETNDETETDINGERVFKYHPRPRAIVWQGEDYTLDRESVGGWNTNGSLLLAFEKAFRPDDYGMSYTDGLQRFMLEVGDIIDDMKDLAATGEPVTGESHLNMTSVQFVVPPLYSPQADGDVEDFFACVLQVRWMG